jgi:cyclin G-associated kinase
MKTNNIKVLICSLHDVLWNGAEWERVGMHEFMEDGPSKLKKFYRKAIKLTHPDRN